MSKELNNCMNHLKMDSLKRKYAIVLYEQVSSALRAICSLEKYINKLTKIHKKDKLYKFSLELYTYAKEQIENLKFVGIAGQINNFGIDFLNLVNNGKIILDGVDITKNCKKATVELIRTIARKFEIIKETPIEDLGAAVLILEILNSELRVKESSDFKNIKKKNLVKALMHDKKITHLREDFNKIRELYHEACSQAGQYPLKYQSDCSDFHQILQNTLYNYRCIENSSNLLSVQLHYVQESLNKIMKSKNEHKEINLYMENIGNYAHKYSAMSPQQNIKNIKDAILEIVEKFDINDKYVDNFLLDEIRLKFPKIINEILDYIYLDDKKLSFSSKSFPSLKCEVEKFEKNLKIVKQHKNCNNSSKSLKIRDENLEAEKYFKGSLVSNSIQKTELLDIGQTLENLKNYALGNDCLFLALIYKFTEILKSILEKDTNNIAEINHDCSRYLNLYRDKTKLKKAKNFSAKIGSLTAAIATIGCFAGFAVDSIHPVVGWTIFSVCSLAFIFNLINAIDKM